jgi:hypothetical protein
MPVIAPTSLPGHGFDRTPGPEPSEGLVNDTRVLRVAPRGVNCTRCPFQVGGPESQLSASRSPGRPSSGRELPIAIRAIGSRRPVAHHGRHRVGSTRPGGKYISSRVWLSTQRG